jgi:hypothetical protein
MSELSFTTLSEHAIAIRDLGKRSIDNVIEIGRLLAEAKAIAGHGEFGPWLDREFRWTERTAQNFMRVYELSKTKCVSDLNLPLAGLYLLAAPSTPEKVRDEVIESAEAGKPVSVTEIKAAVAEHKAAVTGETEEDETEEGETADDNDDETADDDEITDSTEVEEKLRAAEIRIVGLESEVAELKVERDQLRGRVAELEVLVELERESAPPKRGRGRPLGSRNKPKPPATPITVGNDPGPMPEFLRRAS